MRLISGALTELGSQNTTEIQTGSANPMTATMSSKTTP